MNKCFYLSTRKDRNAEAVPLMEALQARGWERTFDWANQGFSGPSEYSDLAVAEISGIRDADVLIVLLPGGYGTHVELDEWQRTKKAGAGKRGQCSRCCTN